MNSKLLRPKEGRVIGGVCVGFAEYFNIDVTIIRLIFVILAIYGGTGVFIYIILLIVIPEKSGESYANKIKQNVSINDKHEIKQNIRQAVKEIKNSAKNSQKTSEIFALILIIAGLIFLAQNFWPSYLNMKQIWPLLLVIIGIVLLASGKKGGQL